MISMENLSYRYPGASGPAVRNLSCEVKPGEIFGFLGPSGAGKSTTQKILIGLIKGWEGRVTVFGRDLSSMRRDYYERIGVSFEMPNLYGKLTALENLRFFASLYRKRGPSPEELLESVGLGDAGHKRVSDFSKGMKIRLNVCRAFVHDPDLLFLDEPTSGQDPTSARLVRDLIVARKAEGKTVFLATHNMSLAADICDRTAFIVDGGIRLIDSPRDLMVRYGRRSLVAGVRRPDGILATARFGLDGIADDTECSAFLRSGRVETLHTEEASLDEIFIRVTGRSLAADSTGSAS